MLPLLLLRLDADEFLTQRLGECSAHGSQDSPMVQHVDPAADAGFVLPLSITGALVLLLSSLSLQSMLLHTRQVQAAERRRLQAEDLLASAAQRLAADFQGQLACLKAVPLAEWPVQAQREPCPPGLNPDAFEQLRIHGQPVKLASWTPQSDGAGQLQLQIPDDGLTRRYWLGSTGVKELG